MEPVMSTSPRSTRQNPNAASPTAASQPPATAGRPGSAVITVVDRADGIRDPLPVPFASVSLYHAPAGVTASSYTPDAADWIATKKADADGVVQFDGLERRGYIVLV